MPCLRLCRYSRRNADIPKGWLVLWQVAEKCGVSEVVVNRWRRRKYISCTRFPRKRGRMSPWCYSATSVEEFLASEEYRHIRAIWDARNPVIVEKKLPAEEALSSCGYSRQELMASRQLCLHCQYKAVFNCQAISENCCKVVWTEGVFTTSGVP